MSVWRLNVQCNLKWNKSHCRRFQNPKRNQHKPASRSPVRKMALVPFMSSEGVASPPHVGLDLASELVRHAATGSPHGAAAVERRQEQEVSVWVVGKEDPGEEMKDRVMRKRSPLHVFRGFVLSICSVPPSCRSQPANNPLWSLKSVTDLFSPAPLPPPIKMDFGAKWCLDGFGTCCMVWY